MIKFRPSIDKEELQGMPFAAFGGEIVVVNTEREADDAVRDLMRCEVVGVDTESKPTYAKGKKSTVALIQISTLERCYLIRVCKMGCIPESVVTLMESEVVRKVGLSFGDDIKAMRRRGEMEIHNSVDLQQIAPEFGIMDKSLAKMYGIVFGEHISKRQRLTNWEAPALTEPQKRYAALDAFATLALYVAFQECREAKEDAVTLPIIEMVRRARSGGVAGTADANGAATRLYHTNADRREDETDAEYAKRKAEERAEKIARLSQELTEEEAVRFNDMINLYASLQGQGMADIEAIAVSGSHRKYYRMYGPSGTFVGVIGDDARENAAFAYISQKMREAQINVPKVLKTSADGMSYLQTDLGSKSLYDTIALGACTGKYSTDEVKAAIVAIRALPRIQFGMKNFDFGECYPEAEFGREGLMADFHKFRECFADERGEDYDAAALEGDFAAMSDAVLGIDRRYWGFMYRDFQSRNIMMRGNTPHFIDYQGGRRGPMWYDVVSFVYQSRANFPEDVRAKLLETYLGALPKFVRVDKGEFLSWLDFFVLLRMVQVLGAYGLRGYREGKRMFLSSIPGALRTVRPLLRRFGEDFPELCGLIERICEKELDRAERVNLTARVFSFSYKKGIPADVTPNGGGYVFDCRGVNNPGRYDAFKDYTGLDQPVIDFLERDGGIKDFLHNIYGLADAHVSNFMERGFTDVMFCCGCTGGRHRSVYSAQHLAEHLWRKFGIKVVLRHVEQGIEKVYERMEKKKTTK